MSLPILPSHRAASTDDLLRLYQRTELHWSRQVAEDETPLETGTALANPQLPKVWHANAMRDAALPEGWTPERAVEEVEQHYAARGVRCAMWALNPAAPPARTQPLGEHLVALGFAAVVDDVMYLAGQPAGAIREVGGIQIIPARASYRHARQLMEEWSRRHAEPQVADAGMLHLEDPQTDALIALKDGAAAALVAVLTVGEIGCIEELIVSEPFRRQGIGRTMMSRALEICARSLFKHVFLQVDPKNDAARALYAQVGFRRIGPATIYLAPHARP